MNYIIKRFSILLLLVAMPIGAEEIAKNNNAAGSANEQLREKQEKIMQLEIEVLELKLQNEKEKVEQLQEKTQELKEQNKKMIAAKPPVKEEKKKEQAILDDKTQANTDKKSAQVIPKVDTINDDFKIRLGLSYLYDNDLIVEVDSYIGGAGFYEGKMISEKTTEASLEIQSPHIYFSSRSIFGLLFSAGYQGFELDQQEINYTDYEDGIIVNFGTRTKGELVYLTPMIFLNPLRNVSVNQSLVIGFGLGLSHIRAKGTTRLTEPYLLGGNRQDQYYNINEVGAIFKFNVDYQWKNIFVGMFVQSSVVGENGADYIYTSSGINAGVSFNL